MQRWEEEAIIRHEGREEGIEIGQEKERLSSIRNIMTNLKLTAEEAMNALKIPESDYEKYKSML